MKNHKAFLERFETAVKKDMRRRKLHDAQIEKMRQMAADGFTEREIASSFDVTRSTVQRYTKGGTQLPQPSGRRHVTPRERIRIRTLAKQGKRPSEIAAIVGISPELARYHLSIDSKC